MKDLFTFKKLLLFLFSGYIINKSVAFSVPKVPVFLGFDLVIINAFAWIVFLAFCILYFFYIDKRNERIKELLNAGRHQEAMLSTTVSENEKLNAELNTALREKQEFQEKVSKLNEEIKVVRSDYELLLNELSRTEKQEKKATQEAAALRNGNDLLKKENEALKKALENFKKKGKAAEPKNKTPNTLAL